MRRGALPKVIGLAVLAGGLSTLVAVLLPWLPTPAAREASRIDFVMWFVVGICIFIFSIVVAVLVYAVTHFRAQPDDLSDGPPIHGHTGLEITWTVIPIGLVTAIAIVSAIVLSDNAALGKNVLHVDVTAQQFAWTFSYPGTKVTTPVLRLPKDRSVLLSFTAKDVIHSFWVPQFGQKQDTVPGIHTQVHVTPDRLGTFPVICTELCGLGHALMRTQVVVMKPAAFDKWLHSQQKGST